jgi:peptidase E
MTTFVLHGGNTSAPSPENDHFFSLFTSLVNKQRVKILLCYFSRLPEDWEKKSQYDIEQIQRLAQKETAFTIAQSPEHLLAEITTHDVLFVAGGYAEYIEPLVPKLISLKGKLQGKVYMGSSMGAFIASEKYVLSSDSADTNTVHNGLGLLPVNTLCHWNVENEKERKLNLLELEKTGKPTLILDEGQSVIFSVLLSHTL